MRMKLHFSKMHGLGNDFVVFDGINQAVCLNADQIRRIADRHLGVGCDQLLLVERPRTPGLDFRYRIFNADGVEVEQCGNGARCFARFVLDKDLTRKHLMGVETQAGVIRLKVESDGRVSVGMGEPRLEPGSIPFIASQPRDRYHITIAGEDIEIGAVSVGNPHAVVRVDHVAGAPVSKLGPLLECHERFPQRTNVGFMEIVHRNHIRLRVFERGVGETRACGTGACAAVVIGRMQGLLEETVTVDLSGGSLQVQWPGKGYGVSMTGPATQVFEGCIEI